MIVQFRLIFTVLIALCAGQILRPAQVQADLEADWTEAFRLTMSLVEYPQRSLSNQEIFQLVTRIEELARPILALSVRQRPGYATKTQARTIQDFVDMRHLAMFNVENCLVKVERKNYHEIYQKLTTTWITYNSDVMKFIREAYELQLAVCVAHLKKHFDGRIEELVFKEDDSERFAKHLALYWPRRPDFSDREASARYLVDILMSYFGKEHISHHIGQPAGLENLISHRFVRKCTVSVVHPLQTLMITLQRAQRPDLEREITERHQDWIMAYQLCDQFICQVDRHWSDAIARYFPRDWNRDLYVPRGGLSSRDLTQFRQQPDEGFEPEAGSSSKRQRRDFLLDEEPRVLNMGSVAMANEPDKTKELTLFTEQPLDGSLDIGRTQNLAETSLTGTTNSNPSSSDFSSQVELMLSNFEAAKGQQIQQHHQQQSSSGTQPADGNQATSGSARREAADESPPREGDLLYLLKGKGKVD